MIRSSTGDVAHAPRTEADVVVVGAGIAGLAVTRQLIKSGLSTVVLEARERVGGRLLSRDGLDLGATWFWPNEPRVQKLIQRLAIPTHSQHLAGNAVYHSPEGVAVLDGNPLDVASLRFTKGAQSLAEAIAHPLPHRTIRLNRPVRTIALHGDRIEARTKDEVVSARHLVLALPPALAMHSIKFSPSLPDRLSGLAANTPVWMGAIAKVVARYRGPFWRNSELAGAGISHLGPLREVHDMSGPKGEPAALFGFAPSASPGTPPITEAEAIEQLTEMFGAEAGNATSVLIQDWRAERYTSPPQVERLTAYQLFGHALYAAPALDGRLHWAGTETATQSPGHIEGALAAAGRAAAAVLGRVEARQAPG